MFWWCLLISGAKSEGNTTETENLPELKPTRSPRQMEYISLISTLLQQTSVLSSVDGLLMATSAVATAALARARPVLVAGFLSYLIYAGTALLAPGTAARMGIMPVRGMRASTGGIVAEAVMRSIQFSPVMSVVTNVTVSVVSDAASRLRLLSRSFSQQLRWVQGRVSTLSTALQSTCVERFLCRVGRFTQDSFPTAAAALRAIG